MLPLDLHVLGTPPAFILSQDQTLHKNILNLKTQLKINKLTMIKVHKRTFFNCTIKLLKSIKSSCSFHFFVFPRLNCSYINEFQKTLQGFFRTFFKKSRLFCISSVLESNSSLKRPRNTRSEPLELHNHAHYNPNQDSNYSTHNHLRNRMPLYYAHFAILTFALLCHRI